MIIRLGFIGAGYWGVTKHLPSIMQISNDSSTDFTLELTNLLESVDSVREQVSANWGFKRSCSTLNELINDKEIDAFVVTINPARLKDVLPYLIKTGKPLFCEKPPGANYEEALSFASMVKQPHLIAFNRRFQPLVKKLAMRLKGKEMHCFQAHMLRHGRLDSHIAKENLQTPQFFKATGIHLIDTLSFLLGELEISDIKNLESKPGMNDGRMVNLVSPGVHGQVMFLPTCGRDEEMIQIHSPETSYRLLIYVNGKNKSLLQVFSKGELVETISNEDSAGHLKCDGFLSEHLAFYEAIVTRTTTESTFATGAASLKLAELIENG